MTISPLTPEKIVVNGRYQLLEKVGEGATAEVFHARHVLLQRDVALKFFRADSDNEMARLHFLDEARAIAQLNHPHILQVYDCDQTPAGELFMAMEFLPNGDLRSRMRVRGLKQQPFTVLDAVTIVKSVARGLAYTHAQGIIHRDIKPSNVFFSQDDRVVIGDFGLAARPLLTLQTVEKERVTGTPAYMAPEQIQGHPTDARTDVYGLGGLMFHLLTGTLPYDAPTIDALLQKHLHAPIPDPRDLRPDLPPPVSEIIRRCLAKDPAARYPSMGALSADLDRLDLQSSDQEITLFKYGSTDTAPASAARTATQTLPLTWRDWLWQGVLALSVAVVVLGAGYLLFGRAGDESPAATPLPALGFNPAQGDEYLILIAPMADAETGVALGEWVAARLRAGVVAQVLGARLRIEILDGAPVSQQAARELSARANAHQIIWATQDPATWTVTVAAYGRGAGVAEELQLVINRDEAFARRLEAEVAALVDYYARFLLMHDMAVEDDLYGLLAGGLASRTLTDAPVELGLSPFDRTILAMQNAFNRDEYNEADRLATLALDLAPNDMALYSFRWMANLSRQQFTLAEREVGRMGQLVGAEAEVARGLLALTYFVANDVENMLGLGPGFRTSQTRSGALLRETYYYLALHHGRFSQVWQEMVAGGGVSGSRLFVEEIRGADEAVAALTPQFLAIQDSLLFDDAARYLRLAGFDTLNPGTFAIGAYVSTLSGDTAAARLSFELGLGLHPDDYLLNWRLGVREAERGNISAAFAYYESAATQAPVPFPIARLLQAEMVLATPELFPDADGCLLLAEARTQAATDAAFYAPLRDRLAAAETRAACD